MVVAAALAYSNTFGVPFVLDDFEAVPRNLTIRQLWPPGEALRPPHDGSPADGRPVVNYSLAVNYAISGVEVWSYHVVNLAIHVLAALTLLGVVRRTLLLPTVPEGIARNATALAGSVALLWAIHPLQTESVTYISQRAESLVSLFYLLTLYCLIRGAMAARPFLWYTACVVACALGMASKEVMVSAPVIALLYDRTFLSGSFRASLRRRWGLYAGLAATWVLLAALVIDSGGRNDTAGFGLGVSPWKYGLTQCGAIVRYVRLSLWPSGLCMDYGDGVVDSLGAVLPQAIAVVGLVLLTLWALWRWPVAGFLGAFFLAVLAPTSSVVPVVTQTVAEHRMYLPLAAVVAAVIVGGYLAGRRLAVASPSPAASRLFPMAIVGLVAAALGTTTFLRNRDYRDDLSMWTDVARKCPDNVRALNSLGRALVARGEVDAAVVQFSRIVELDPDYAAAQHDLGLVLMGRGDIDGAMARFCRALELEPDNVEAHNSLGVALASLGRFDEGIAHLRQALTIQPEHADAGENLKLALADRAKTLSRKLAGHRAAIVAHPNDLTMLNDAAWILATSAEGALRNGAEAIELARRAVELSGGKNPRILDTLAAAYAESSRFTEAARTAQEAAELAARQNDSTLASSLRARARLYQQQKTPFPKEPAPPATGPR